MRRVGPARLLAGFGLLAVAALVVGSQLTPASQGAFIAGVRNSTNTAVTPTAYTCAAAVDVDDANALFVYRLDETTGTTATDMSGHGANGTYRGTLATSTVTPMGCPRDLPARAYLLNGTSSFVSSPTTITDPENFSIEVWFKTSATQGRLIGFGNSPTGLSGNYDRHIYLTTAGRLSFGVYNNGYNVITSPAAYNNNAWHHVVATMSVTAGTVLYVDGVPVATGPTFTAAENTTGVWRIGYDNLAGWPGIQLLLPNYYFTGQMRFAAAYGYTLTAQQVAAHYNTGK